MKLREILARNLRRLREAKGVSQEVLAAEAGISREYLSKMEKAGCSAGIDVVEKLARAFGVEPGQLLEKFRPGKG